MHKDTRCVNGFLFYTFIQTYPKMHSATDSNLRIVGVDVTSIALDYMSNIFSDVLIKVYGMMSLFKRS